MGKAKRPDRYEIFRDDGHGLALCPSYTDWEKPTFVGQSMKKPGCLLAAPMLEVSPVRNEGIAFVPPINRYLYP
jgi:hypothetical protein